MYFVCCFLQAQIQVLYSSGDSHHSLLFPWLTPPCCFAESFVIWTLPEGLKKDNYLSSQTRRNAAAHCSGWRHKHLTSHDIISDEVFFLIHWVPWLFGVWRMNLEACAASEWRPTLWIPGSKYLLTSGHLSALAAHTWHLHRNLMLLPCLTGLQCSDTSHHACSSDLNSFISLLCCQWNELGDWPHPITPLINSIRESWRLASIKPDTFCPCPGINSRSSLDAALHLTHSVQGKLFCKVLNTGTPLNDNRFW